MPSQPAAAQAALNHRPVAPQAHDFGRVDVSESVSISTGIATRYATAVFELAKEGDSLKVLEGDTNTLDAALRSSKDFAALIHSPIYSRDQQRAAIEALAKRMQLSSILANALALMAAKRRLFVVLQLVARLRDLIAEENGEVTAEVTAAKELTDAQRDKLAESLKASVGKDVKFSMAVDESLIGGLVVKVGSKMIDTSIASKLGNLQNAMKEVG